MESRPNAIIYWTLLAYKEWSFYIAASEKGLSYVGSQQKPFEEMRDWISRRFPESELVQDDEKMAPYVQELIEYLQGKRQVFS
ncbi:MAG TPA: cysteine methyltransferase, partial [Paenibacillus sp.]|nr:cysteine methyltransferase [Paenibacillus sp.]